MTTVISSSFTNDNEPIEIMDSFCLLWSRTTVKKYDSISTWYCSHEGLRKNIQRLGCFHTYQGRNHVSCGSPCGTENWTLKKQDRVLIFLNFGIEEGFWKYYGWPRKRTNQYKTPKFSLEAQIIKFKLSYFGHITQDLTLWRSLECWNRWKESEEDDKHQQNKLP